VSGHSSGCGARALAGRRRLPEISSEALKPVAIAFDHQFLLVIVVTDTDGLGGGAGMPRHRRP
jgi:hypothetical protein